MNFFNRRFASVELSYVNLRGWGWGEERGARFVSKRFTTRGKLGRLGGACFKYKNFLFRSRIILIHASSPLYNRNSFLFAKLKRLWERFCIARIIILIIPYHSTPFSRNFFESVSPIFLYFLETLSHLCFRIPFSPSPFRSWDFGSKLIRGGRNFVGGSPSSFRSSIMEVDNQRD